MFTPRTQQLIIKCFVCHYVLTSLKTNGSSVLVYFPFKNVKNFDLIIDWFYQLNMYTANQILLLEKLDSQSNISLDFISLYSDFISTVEMDIMLINDVIFDCIYLCYLVELLEISYFSWKQGFESNATFKSNIVSNNMLTPIIKATVISAMEDVLQKQSFDRLVVNFSVYNYKFKVLNVSLLSSENLISFLSIYLKEEKLFLLQTKLSISIKL